MPKKFDVAGGKDCIMHALPLEQFILYFFFKFKRVLRAILVRQRRKLRRYHICILMTIVIVSPCLYQVYAGVLMRNCVAVLVQRNNLRLRQLSLLQV